jgi:ankyrin repeat protein
MDLFAAIDAGDLDAAVAALDADPEAGYQRHADGATPVLYALYQGQPGIASALGDRLERLDLAEASALDRVERVRALLADGEPVDGRTPDGFTPLQLAAFFGAPASAALLIESGADLDAVADNPMRIQPLHAATAGRHREIALLLIAAGAELDGRQRHGWTPLLAAADHGDGDVVAALLAAGADPSAANDDGLRPADAARAKGHAALADELDAASLQG